MSGVGSRNAGGRWNSPEHYVTYASGDLTLAMFELVVHIDDAAAFRTLPHVHHAITFPHDALTVLEAEDLPTGWAAQPVTRASQVVGDAWIEGRQAPILAIPSVIVPCHHRYESIHMNYLIDPNHPDFDRAIDIGRVIDMDLDRRLLE